MDQTTREMADDLMDNLRGRRARIVGEVGRLMREMSILGEALTLLRTGEHPDLVTAKLKAQLQEGKS